MEDLLSKYYLSFSILFLVFATDIWAENQSVLEFYDATNPEKTASMANIAAFSQGFKAACLKNFLGTQEEKNKFCQCVLEMVQYNMINALTPTEAKQTIRGAASGMQPIPNAEIVFFGVDATCSSKIKK
jgi:hypothetical protein